MTRLKDTASKYSYHIEYDAEDNVYIARCAELSGLAAHGKDQVVALKEINKVVLETLKWMVKDGEEVPEPFSLHHFSGKLPLRMPPEKHRKIAIEASLQNVSMNQFILNKI